MRKSAFPPFPFTTTPLDTFIRTNKHQLHEKRSIFLAFVVVNRAGTTLIRCVARGSGDANLARRTERICVLMMLGSLLLLLVVTELVKMRLLQQRGT